MAIAAPLVVSMTLLWVAVKTLLQHIALAHRDWLPTGVLPATHLQQTQALLHTLTGESALLAEWFTFCASLPSLQL